MTDTVSFLEKLTIFKTKYRKHKIISKKSLSHSISLVLVSGLLSLSGCATKPMYQTNNSRSIQVNDRGVPNFYRVKSGDTVSQIANRYGLNYRQVGALNHLDGSYTIYSGQWLKLWEGGRRAPVPKTTSRPAANPYPVAAAAGDDYTATVKSTQGYVYPSNNQVIKNFNPDTAISGMWFSGKVGDPIVASKGGEVLYAGNGLPEYGNLIMIRHDAKYITAYAHNEKLLVKEGDKVSAGQRIALMGNSGDINQVALEFQVRENGIPIDPRAVLGF